MLCSDLAEQATESHESHETNGNASTQKPVFQHSLKQPIRLQACSHATNQTLTSQTHPTCFLLWGGGDSTITTIPKRYKRTVEIQQKSHDGTHEIERVREREREREEKREEERV